MKNFVLKFLRSTIFQPIWENLYRLSKIGMNFWGGASLSHSGELYALKIMFKKLSKKDKVVVFDVGANFGQFAGETLRMATKSTLIYSFEPSLFSFNKLKKFISDNSFTNSILPFQFAMGDKSEKLILYKSGDGASTASAYNLNDQYLLKEEVDVTTIDLFCCQNNIDYIDYLKIDIEGHELFALYGAKEMIDARKIHFIQFEFGESNVESKTYFRDFHNLLSPNYDIYRIVSDGIRLVPNYSSNCEVFSTINYLAILKKN